MPAPQPGVAQAQRKERPWAILRRWETWLLGLVAVLLGAAEHSFRTYFLLYLKEVILLPVVLAGWYLALSHGSGLFGRIGWGLMSDRFGHRKGMLALETLLAASALFLLGAAWGSPWSLPLLALAFGFTGGGWVSIWTAMLTESASSHSAGREMGLAMTFAYGGVILGPILFGRGVDLAGGSYGVTWMLLAGTTALASGLVLLLKDR
jgi:predicted MFS family arabinose efflux permease